MFRASCVAVVGLGLLAAAPAPSFAQSLSQTASSQTGETMQPNLLVADGGELSMEALLATYPVIPAAVTSQDSSSTRALVISAGALAGVVALNFYMGGLAYLPFTGVVATTPMATAESIVAISRVYAVAAAAAGGLAANWLYERSTAQPSAAAVASRRAP